MSKYLKAIKKIRPCSPAQIKVQLDTDTGIEHTPQQIATALYNFKLRGSVVQLDNGLYDLSIDQDLGPDVPSSDDGG